jgi:predicted phosphohydrolase
MARGWESKSVEAQKESAEGAPSAAPRRPLTEEEKKVQRELDRLRLARAYVLQQIESTSSERYKESLRQALSEIEQKLGQSGTAR